MKNDPTVFLKHVIESIDFVEEYVGAMEKAEFLEDHLTQDAVIRRIQVIGEAIKNLPREFSSAILKSDGRTLRGCGTNSFTGILGST